MDDHLRELERLAATGDIAAANRYLAGIIRSGEIDRLERQARLGDQAATRTFLRALHFLKELNLNSLWAYSFWQEGNYTQGNTRPVLAAFPIPFSLDLSYQSIPGIYRSMGFASTRYGRTLEEAMSAKDSGAYIVEDITIEMAEKVVYGLNFYFEFTWPNYGFDMLAGGDEETYHARQQASQDVYFSIIRAGALLLMDQHRGLIFPPVHELGSYPRHPSQRMRQYNMNAEQAGLPIRTIPRRRFSIHTESVLPYLPGGTREAYKVVLHVPSGRAYTNDRGYNLLDEEVSPEVILEAMRHHTQIDVGQKATTRPQQEPAWSRNLPDEEFITYTVGL